MTVVIFILLAGLAAANGGNDVSKGVATLGGAGVVSYRTAVVWGTVATLAGSLCSLVLAERMTALFSKGIVSAPATDQFAFAVLLGTASWIAFATLARLPVSTTQALVGALIGAGLLLTSSGSSVHFEVLGTKVVLPMLASVLVAYTLSALLKQVRRHVAKEHRCTCAGDDTPDGSYGSGTAVLTECAVHRDRAARGSRVVTAAHWLSSGAASFARGLNDTPKIVAIGTFSLIPAGMTITQVLLTVALAMAAGSMVGGLRVARRLGEDVVKMSHGEGMTANVTTAVLVGFGAGAGLPMSTTQVSTGAIAGIAGHEVGRLNLRSLRDFLIAWTATPLVAAGIAALAFLLVS
ncbi:inorganic phosphate transporter, PiT family [Nonomuraea solani]|uniref:Inorganic phosphate transporter, PiT family n=1 Tax=Nonomuraea solani TaxID=1144553 RepID=A0A1H6F0A0_9ACTN|nr:inorganic phosphate transporter [Nonomuraea solani]SEH03472.1 inorganic phosphate transporter, PiT family [Nonomuraea solani]